MEGTLEGEDTTTYRCHHGFFQISRTGLANKLCAVVDLVLKNAFNSAGWGKIIEPKYLVCIVI